MCILSISSKVLIIIIDLAIQNSRLKTGITRIFEANWTSSNPQLRVLSFSAQSCNIASQRILERPELDCKLKY